MPSTEERLMTGEELARHPDLDPCELVNGRVMPMAPVGPIHGGLVARLGARLVAYVDEIGDTLRDEEILPGFVLPLSELFRD